MGIARGTSLQVVTSPRYTSNWNFLDNRDLIDLHAIIVARLQKLPSGPMHAIQLIFRHDEAIRRLSKNGLEFLSQDFSAKRQKTHHVSRRRVRSGSMGNEEGSGSRGDEEE